MLDLNGSAALGGSVHMRRAIFFCAVLTWSAVVAAQSVYFGNLHAHTSYSDGSGTPAEAYAMARSAGLDFFAVTEHNHHAADGKGARKDGKLIAVQPQLYAGTPASLVETANALNKPGKFVTLYGQEISTISSGNHMNVFQVGQVVDDGAVPNGDVPALLNWIRAHPDSSGHAALLQFNHPRDPDRNPKDYGHDDFAPSEWVRALDAYVELVEVLNAPALTPGEHFRAEAKEGYYLDYLNFGFHLGPSVGQDNHWKNWGTSTEARIGVIANSLTRDAILGALRARHTTASDDKDLKIIFRSGESLGGDVIAPPVPIGAALPLTVEIEDSDEPDARYRIDVLTDHAGGDRARRPVNTFIVNGDTHGRYALDGITFDGPGQFVLLRVTQSSIEQGDAEHQESEDRLWTAPVWFEAAVPAPVAGSAMRIAELLPNPAGDDAQNEAVTLANAGAGPMNLAGWQLRDASGNVWLLGGSVAPGQKVTFRRSSQAMSLNNDGDTVELVDPSGIVADSGHYGHAAEGQIVTLERP
jgi:hypothetical protein